MNEPIGSLCVLPDEQHAHWLVSICQGGGHKAGAAPISNRGEQGAEWAIEERGRGVANCGASMTIHFPDDCPCGGGGSNW